MPTKQSTFKTLLPEGTAKKYHQSLTLTSLDTVSVHPMMEHGLWSLCDTDYT